MRKLFLRYWDFIRFASTHALVQLLGYGLYAHAFAMIYAIAFVLINPWILGTYIIFMFLFYPRLSSRIEANEQLPTLIRSLLIAMTATVIVFIFMAIHQFLFHWKNDFPWQLPSYKQELLFALSYIFPVLLIGDLLLRRKLIITIISLVLVSSGLLINYLLNDTSSWQVPEEPLFTEEIEMGKIQDPLLEEASGLAISRTMKDVLWSHNDLGDSSGLFLLGNRGEALGRLFFKDYVMRDWEDLAIGPGPISNTSYLYVGDIGNNVGYLEEGNILRLAEPQYTSEELPLSDTIRNYEVIRFRYPDKKRDAETLFLDPQTLDLYILSKREAKVRLYLLAYPYSTSEVNTLKFVQELPVFNVVGGDLSLDGQELLIKTYRQIFYWQRRPGESIAEMTSRSPVALPYIPEPQGEAVAWAHDHSGYFSLSEKRGGVTPRLYFYERQ